MPGACAYYQWEVPESAGPAAGDSSTKAWLYHGHVSETGDTNAGLVGAIIIGRAGATRAADRKPTDVDREFGEQHIFQRIQYRRSVCSVETRIRDCMHSLPSMNEDRQGTLNATSYIWQFESSLQSETLPKASYYLMTE